MIDVDGIGAILRRCCCDERLELAAGLGGEYVASIRPDCLVAAVQALMEQQHVHHLGAISGLDTGDGFQVLYHFWSGGGLTLRVSCPKGRAVLPTLVPLIPTADWYEREVHELLGIDFAGHPGLARLLLPEDWDGPPPLLRKKDAQ